MIPRETIYQALFGYATALRAPGAVDGPPDGLPNSSSISAAAGSPTLQQPFNLVSREVIEVQRVPPNLQPVLFMDEALEDYVDSGTGLYSRKWTVYFHVGCTTLRGTAAATILNPLLDTLEAALLPGDDNYLGLGDRVTKAQFAGVSAKNLGNNSTDTNFRQAVAYLPFQLIFGPY